MRQAGKFSTILMPAIRLLYGLTLTGYMGTLGLLTAWYAWLDPSTHFPVAYALLVMLTPLLFALRGMLHGRRYTVQWSGFLALFYFIHGVGEAYASETARYLGLLEILFTSTWFVAGILYIRRSRDHTQT